MPEPARTAASRLVSSSFSMRDMVMTGTIRSLLPRSGSAKDSVLVSTVTVKPWLRQHVAHEFGAPLGRVPFPAAPDDQGFLFGHRSGSSVELSKGKVGAHGGGPGALMFEVDALAAFRRAKDRIHDLEHMQADVVAGAMRPAADDRLRHVGQPEDAVVAVAIEVRLGQGGPVALLLRRPARRPGTGWDREPASNRCCRRFRYGCGCASRHRRTW